ncbi:gp40 [Aeromonas phage 31]|uniref:Gp40 n=1 Tax=Aeromonas phage 31 TaxID=321023 RepID=Q56EX9_9CAUD|nr:head vertex assembly chaperone [Aeromonas phage 31]APU00927.1 capsid and scaffold protein [Aeromonas phage 31.2]APU01837.1 capsid and scaffold protein [Aeromonas phage L9-6]APU02087.1 capsid and scaffold protein [Aeromonas phage Riv-10]APU02334.1 capsid and scaffold protein [Aeromonas phage SW69-9]AAX63521.1 gp40 [Aeromonas phage 31]
MSDNKGAAAPQSLEEAHSLIKQSMADVKQELLIIDKKGKSHLVYVFDAHYNDGKLHVEYKTVSDSEELHGLVHEALQIQIKQIMKDKEDQKWSKQFLKICYSTIRTLFRRTRT